MKDLVIVGAGGFARETASAAAAAGLHVLGFADDDPALHGTVRSGLPVLGPVDGVAGLSVAFPHRGATPGLIAGELLAGEGVDGVPRPLLAPFRATRSTG